MKPAKLIASLIAATLITQPALAKTSLSAKDRARVARAAPKDRDDVRWCLIKRKQGAKKGTLIGAGAGAGAGIITGGNLGETALAAGAGAVAGNLLGRGTSTNKTCDRVLARNK